MKRIRSPTGLRQKTPSGGDDVILIKHLRKSDIEVITQLGYTIDNYAPSGWIYVKESINSHIDRNGYCLVYCSSGIGTLVIDDDDEFATLLPNTYTVFDDNKYHSFKCHTRYVNLMVVGVTESNPTKDQKVLSLPKIELSKGQLVL